MHGAMSHRLFAYGWPLILLGAAVWIWHSALRMHAFSGETALLLVGIPVAVLCGAPWKPQHGQISAPGGMLFASALLLFLGSTLQSILLMALAWTGLFDAWTRVVFNQSTRSRHTASYLAFLSFPWLAIEGQRIGWWFRESGAHIGAQLFQGLGFPVERRGTTVFVDQLPIDVTEACSGLQTLQVFLLIGGLLAFFESTNSKRHLVALLVLPLAAWAANTLRILLVTISGLTFGADAAAAPMHAWPGITSALLVLGCYRSCVRALNAPSVTTYTIKSPPTAPIL